MNEPKWLWDDESYYDRDWLMEYLPDVGVFCPHYSFISAENIRFEWFEDTDCPHCKYFGRNYLMSNKKYKCKKCRKKFSLTTNTYLHSTKLPMEYWFRLSYLLADLKIPLNSMSISRDLCISQKACYYNLLKVKEALGYEFKGINFKIPLNIDSYNLMKKLLTLKIV